MSRFFLVLFLVSSLSALGVSKDWAEADQLYSIREDESAARRALGIYTTLVENEFQNHEAFLRLSMASQFVGMRYEKESKVRKKHFLKGKEAGLRALELAPQCGACHFWTAINMALFAKEVGIVKTLFTLGEVQNHLAKAAELDRTYAYGGAYRVLALIERNLPGILGGSDRRAVEYLEKAIQASPNAVLNYFFLAQVWQVGFQDNEKALQVALKGLSLPLIPDAALEEREARREIVELVKILKLPPPKRPTRDVSR